MGPVKDPLIFPFAWVVRGASRAILLGKNGVQNEVEAWIAPLKEASIGRAQWRQLVKRDDDVTVLAANSTTLYLLTHKDAPTFTVKAIPLDGTLTNATTLIPARADRVIESIHAAADGVYVAGRRGLDAQLLLHVGLDGKVAELNLPFRGNISEVATDPTQAGAVVELEGWITPPTQFRYDSAKNAFTRLDLSSGPTLDPKRYSVAELSAKAADGTRVPLSVVAPAGPLSPPPPSLHAYAS